MTSQQASHDSRQWASAGTSEYMHVIWQKRPRIDAKSCEPNEIRQVVEERRAVALIPKDDGIRDTARDDVMEGAGGVKSGAAGHRCAVYHKAA
jgi:hypothetical protein